MSLLDKFRASQFGPDIATAVLLVGACYFVLTCKPNPAISPSTKRPVVSGPVEVESRPTYALNLNDLISEEAVKLWDFDHNNFLDKTERASLVRYVGNLAVMQASDLTNARIDAYNALKK
ncbi:MAG: hypothetical protein ACP5NS_00530 [Candidatus Pacearchaeota archaeon]